MSQNDIPLNVILDPELDAAVRAFCADRRTNRSDGIRQLLGIALSELDSGNEGEWQRGFQGARMAIHERIEAAFAEIYRSL